MSDELKRIQEAMSMLELQMMVQLSRAKEVRILTSDEEGALRLLGERFCLRFGQHHLPSGQEMNLRILEFVQMHKHNDAGYNRYLDALYMWSKHQWGTQGRVEVPNVPPPGYPSL